MFCIIFNYCSENVLNLCLKKNNNKLWTRLLTISCAKSIEFVYWRILFRHRQQSYTVPPIGIVECQILVISYRDFHISSRVSQKYYYFQTIPRIFTVNIHHILSPSLYLLSLSVSFFNLLNIWMFWFVI